MPCIEVRLVYISAQKFWSPIFSGQEWRPTSIFWCRYWKFKTDSDWEFICCRGRHGLKTHVNSARNATRLLFWRIFHGSVFYVCCVHVASRLCVLHVCFSVRCMRVVRCTYAACTLHLCSMHVPMHVATHVTYTLHTCCAYDHVLSVLNPQSAKMVQITAHVVMA